MRAFLSLVLAVSFFGALALFFEEAFPEWGQKQNQKRKERSNCILKDDHVFFPKGYYFRYGFMKGKRQLPYDLIEEIRVNTQPITAKVDGNELIFLKGLKREEVVSKAEQKNIPIKCPIDNWSLICDEFLDTEFTPEQQERTLSILEQNSISRAEVNKIRKRLRWRMLLRTYVSWEWVYYGQHDVLSELFPLTKKKYWWAMEIALRGGKSLEDIQRNIA